MKFTDSEIQSTGTFLVGQLERLDPHNYDPIGVTIRFPNT